MGNEKIKRSFRGEKLNRFYVWFNKIPHRILLHSLFSISDTKKKNTLQWKQNISKYICKQGCRENTFAVTARFGLPKRGKSCSESKTVLMCLWTENQIEPFNIHGSMCTTKKMDTFQWTENRIEPFNIHGSMCTTKRMDTFQLGLIFVYMQKVLSLF